MATQNLGRVGLVLKGEWDSATAYTALDVVSHDGNAWAAKQNSTNVEPTTGNSDFWQLFSNSADLVATVQGYKEDAASSAAAAAASAADAEASAQYGEDAFNAIAHTFDPGVDYTAGKYVWYNGELYRFNAAHPAGTWIGTDAARYTATDELPLIEQALGTKADAAEVAELKSAFNLTLVAASYVPSIRSGAFLDNTTGIKTNNGKYAYSNLFYASGLHRLAINLDSTSYVYRVGYYGENGSISDGTGYIGSSGDMRSGLVYIPENAVKIGISARRTDNATIMDTDIENIHNAITLYVQTDTTLRNAYAPANALSVRQYISEFIKGGNSVLTFDNEDYSVTTNGLTISVKDGIISIKGRRETDTRDVVKLSNGYELSTTGTVADWLTETLPEFEIGETYSIHNIILSGSLPSGFGVVIKYSDGSNMLSDSYKERQAASVPAIAQIVTAGNVDVDVSFIPVFVHGKLSDSAYWAKLQPGIKVDGAKIFGNVDFSANYIYDSTLEYAFKVSTAYKPTGEPTPLVIICHGLSSTISASSWGAQTVADKFVNAGYAVMDVNRVTTQDWCNPALIAKYITALKDILTKYNVKPMYVYGLSMGSLIGLCMSTVVPGIKAAAISGIRLDLEARYNELSAADKAIVDANLGFTNGYDAYKAAGWCKTAFACIDASENKINPVQFPPTIFIYGTTDTLTKEESLAKIDEIKRGMTICVANEYVGDHGAVCTLSAGTSLSDTLAWFAQWS